MGREEDKPNSSSGEKTPPPSKHGNAMLETPLPGRNTRQSDSSSRLESGDLVCINDGELAVYFQPSPDGAGAIVFSLLADGTIRLDCLTLESARPVVLGTLQPESVGRLEAAGRWSRPMIADACSKPEYAALIPTPSSDDSPTPTERKMVPPSTFGEEEDDEEELIFDLIDDDTPLPTVAPKHSRRFKLLRGQRLTVRFGGRSWEAVYWGRDHIGAVVAHQTGTQWELLRLDLERYKDSILVDPEISAELIDQVGAYLAKQAESGR